MCHSRSNKQCFGQEYVNLAAIGTALVKNVSLSQQQAMLWSTKHQSHINKEGVGQMSKMHWGYFTRVFAMF